MVNWKRAWEQLCRRVFFIFDNITELHVSIFLALVCIGFAGGAWELLDFQRIQYNQNHIMMSPVERIVEAGLCVLLGIWAGFFSVKYFRDFRADRRPVRRR